MALKVAVAALCLAFAGARPVQAAGTITLDPATTYQSMTGWEATAWASQDSPAFPNFRDTLFDQAVNDVGINRLRVEVRSGAENSQDYWTQYQTGAIDYATWRSVRYSTVNDNDDPDAIDWNGFHFSELDDVIEQIVIPFKQRVEANGDHLYINLNYVAFTSQIGPGLLYHHDDPEEYTEFILAALLHLRNQYGWSPDAVEVILEPDNVSQWNGPLIGQAIVACAAKLSANGFTPRFIAPSNTNMGNAVSYFDQLIQVPGALGYLSELSYHRYAGVSDANLQAIAARAEQNNIGASMLEWWSGSNGYQILHKDLKEGRNSAWQQAVISGHFDIDESDPDNPVVTINSATQFTRQYFRFVRAGAVRIGAASDSGELDPLAFVNADGRYALVVKAGAPADFTVQGLPAGIYAIRYTTAAESDVALPDQTIGAGESVSATIPAAGVVSIHATVGFAPEVLLEVHPNERAPGSNTGQVIGGNAYTRPAHVPGAMYWWKHCRFVGSDTLWIQVEAQNWNATQNGTGDDDNLRLRIDGVTPVDYDLIQNGPFGSWQWRGSAENGHRWTLRFLYLGLSPVPVLHALQFQADETPAIWWVKVTDLEPGVIEAF
jgi:O-glycosyl hydrolase